MTRKIRDIMTPVPMSVAPIESVAAAARVMRDHSIGALLVVDDDKVHGIVTDRDITVRVLAEDLDPVATRVGDIASTDLVTIGPDEDVTEAVRIIRDRAVRRLPVMDGGALVGVVSLGDLALWQDEGSVLADVAAARPSR
jgi:CBS domain-containing protein